MSKRLFLFSVLFLVASVVLNTVNLMICCKKEEKYSEKVVAKLISESAQSEEKPGAFDFVSENIIHFYNFAFTRNGCNYICNLSMDEAPLLEQMKLYNNNKAVLLINPSDPSDAIFSQSLKKFLSIIFIVASSLLTLFQIWRYLNYSEGNKKKNNSTKEIIIRRYGN